MRQKKPALAEYLGVLLDKQCYFSKITLLCNFLKQKLKIVFWLILKPVYFSLFDTNIRYVAGLGTKSNI